MDGLKELGAKLVEDSQLHEEFAFQRGLINELFPFVYEASKRMSSRAISRWLAENGTKLSAATIAKALRNADSYWHEIWENIEPAAMTFERAHKVSAQTFLAESDLFEDLSHRPPILEGVSSESVQDSFDEYEGACEKLREDWFTMPAKAIEACLARVNLGETEGKEERSEKEATS